MTESLSAQSDPEIQFYESRTLNTAREYLQDWARCLNLPDSSEIFVSYQGVGADVKAVVSYSLVVYPRIDSVFSFGFEVVENGR